MNLPYSTNRENRGGTGFTLIELLVVIAIIGIITAIVLVILAGTRGEARDAVRMNDLRQLQNILERYQFDKDIYPLSTENYQIENHPWGSYWEGYGGVPKDP